MADPAARPWELRTWTSERACPACGVPLFAAERDGYRIDACGSCSGAWLGHIDARRMIDTANRTVIDLARMSDAAPRRPVAAGPRTCPDCKAALVPETLGNVEIDVCDGHGTWFDRFELERVATLLVRDYGPAARRAAAEAAAPKREAPLVDVRNVAAGVAALTLGLLGVAIGASGAPIETDVFGRRLDPITRLPDE